MMREQQPTKENTNLWDGCFWLVVAARWQPSETDHFTHQRSVWWSKVNDEQAARYKLTAQANRKGFFQRRQAEIYQLTSAIAPDEEVQEFSRYFIMKEGLYKVLHSRIPVREDGWITASDERAIRDSHDFALDHGLAEPAEDDVGTVRKILNTGLLDGVHPNLIGGNRR